MRQDERICVRRYPYPYRAMLAVCSDLDETPDREVYRAILRYLNTTEVTPMGPGVGLEVGGTIYFDMPDDQFAYWTTDDAGRAMVRDLIRSGHVDCLHSYGSLATSRAHAVRALDELERHDCRLAVWIDHGRAPTNFGADIMCGHGDEIDHPAYHADLTLDHGVRYVWRGRVTSVVGQDAPPRPMGAWKARRPLASARTAAKETVKWLAAHRGSVKYSMHGANEVMREIALRDGRQAVEFLRSNPHWAGVSRGETAMGIGEVLTDAMLRNLIAREGVCVLYTHLGKVRDPAAPFDAKATAGFERLRRARDAGGILTATTARLLGYLEMRNRAEVVPRGLTGGGLALDVSLDDAGGRRWDPAGLTVYVPEPERTKVFVNGTETANVWVNPPDHTGRPSVSIQWPRLEFPSL